MKCISCGRRLDVEVLHSAAGYYIGTWCDFCGPHSRESDYFKTELQARYHMRNYERSSKKDRAKIFQKASSSGAFGLHR